MIAGKRAAALLLALAACTLPWLIRREGDVRPAEDKVVVVEGASAPRQPPGAPTSSDVVPPAQVVAQETPRPDDPLTPQGLADVMRVEGRDPEWSGSMEVRLRRALDGSPLARLPFEARCARSICELSGVLPGSDRPHDREVAMQALQGRGILKAFREAGVVDRDVGVISDDGEHGGATRFRRFLWRS